MRTILDAHNVNAVQRQKDYYYLLRFGRKFVEKHFHIWSVFLMGLVDIQK